MKRCSTPPIMETQIKTTIRYHLTPVRMAIIKRQEITSVGEGVEKRKTCTLYFPHLFFTIVILGLCSFYALSFL